MMRSLFVLLPAALLALPGCGGSAGMMGHDASVAADLAVDMAAPTSDLATPPDLRPPPDLAMSDLTMSDLAISDLAVPPDFAPPLDLNLQDLTPPPDLVTLPDLRIVDLTVPSDLALPPDLATLPDFASAPDLAGPKVVNVVVGPNGSLAFAPVNVTIHVGDTVRWTWGSNNHNVVSGTNGVADNKFCSPNDMNCANAGLSNAGFVYTHVFNAVGNYPYFCQPHAFAGMTGTVVVQ